MVLAQNQESFPLEKHGLVAKTDLAEVLEGVFYELLVGNELLDYAGPGLVKTLVPNARGKVLLDVYLLTISYLCNLPLLMIDFFGPLLEWHFVYLVDEDKDVGVLVELLNAAESHLEVLQDLLMLLAVLDLEHVDQHLDSSENSLFLHEEILLHESVLPSTVPQVQG